MTGDHVAVSVVVEVHQLWTKANTSASLNAGDFASGFEVDWRLVLGVGLGSHIQTDFQFATAKLTDQQVPFAISIHVGQIRGGVPDFGIDYFPPE